jgi:poly-gamma-glutamate capsule biosynthesis protein CapA/YwtB (metallophosphatase superfamily)
MERLPATSLGISTPQPFRQALRLRAGALSLGLGCLFLLGTCPACQLRPLVVAAAGDLQLGRVPAQPLPAGLLDGTVRLVNLEGPLTARGQETGLDGEGRPRPGEVVRFRAAPERAAVLRGRVDVVSLGNNHALDQGEAGRDDTVHALASQGIAAALPARAAEIVRAGRRVIVLARDFAPAADLDVETELVEETRRAAARGVVLVSLHWGHTGSLLPTAAQRRLGARLIDAGATAVLGHGPHTLQGVERHGRGIIAYSLGNLAFACGCTEVADAYVVRLVVDQQGHAGAVRVRPIVAGLQRPAASASDPELYELIATLSADLGSTVRREGAELVIE